MTASVRFLQYPDFTKQDTALRPEKHSIRESCVFNGFSSDLEKGSVSFINTDSSTSFGSSCSSSAICRKPTVFPGFITIGTDASTLQPTVSSVMWGVFSERRRGMAFLKKPFVLPGLATVEKTDLFMLYNSSSVHPLAPVMAIAAATRMCARDPKFCSMPSSHDTSWALVVFFNFFLFFEDFFSKESSLVLLLRSLFFSWPELSKPDIYALWCCMTGLQPHVKRHSVTV
mmetsp:Transcript_4066/g.10032  ORF Transcript_4066/g.10032 Transcript_4066/m.10032 type:complete len:229 (-) Transcript_4066:12-698(-)